MEQDEPDSSAGDSRTERLAIPAGLDGVRLDRALAELVEGFSRERLQEMVRDGHVRVEGGVVTKPARPVAAGERVEVRLRERDRSRPGSRPELELAVLHEDPHLLVVDKPAGMVVHPGGLVRGGTVSELLEARFGPLPALQRADGDPRPGIVHRLDRDTSGAMVVARTEEAGRDLLQQFARREVEKTYAALVHGEPRFDSDWITAPIERLRSGRGDRMAVAREGEGRPAETFYEVRERLGAFAFVGCRPRTGRTHQIRVHLASIGHPVVGDTLYRSRRTAALEPPAGAPRVTRQLLHAERLAFRHPAGGERLEVRSPLPAEMEALLAWLRDAG